MKTLAKALCILSAFILAETVSAQAVLDSLYCTNGQVNAIALSGNTIYIGGNFTYVGPPTGGGVTIDSSTGRPSSAFPKILGTVNVTAPDGSGGWYVGGAFTFVGGVARNNVAHIKSDWTVDTSWNPNANSSVLALAVSGSTVFAAGNFLTISGQTRNYIAALDATTGAATNWNPSANGNVLMLAVYGSTVYAGGNFTTIGGQARNYMAALDAATGTATTWNPNANGFVDALVVSGSTVYAAGNFMSIGGQTRNYIAALDATTGTATSWNPNANGYVCALAATGSLVYVGGNFSTIGGQTRNCLAALDITTGTATTWNPNAGSKVLSLAVSGSTVYAGGIFTTMSGQPRNYAAAIDSATGTTTPWNPNATGSVNTLSVFGRKVFVGGAFTSIGGLTRNRIAALDATTGTATSWNPSANASVTALAVSGSIVYAGGTFTNIGGQTRNYIAALDATTGAAITWNPNANSYVGSLAVSGTTVYAGGVFTVIGGQARSYIASLDATTGLATSWNPVANGQVSTLMVSGSTVYAGGRFTSIGGQARNYIAALDLMTGAATSWNPNANNYVNAVALSGTTFYAGGSFTAIGGQTRNFIAALDVTTGAASAWNPSANVDVSGLSLSGITSIYAVGSFTNIGGFPNRFVANIGRATGSAPSWVTAPNNGSGINAIAIDAASSRMYVGGSFLNVSNVPHTYLVGYVIPSDSIAVPDLNGTTGFPNNWHGWIRWSIANGASTYDLQVSTGSNFSTVVLDTANLSNDSCQVFMTAGATTYYYRIRGRQGSGISSWSAVGSFNTNPTEIPNALGTVGFPDNWQGWIHWSTTTGATTYDLQVSTNSAFTALVIDTTSLPNDSCYVTNMVGPASYFYRVRGTQILGVGPWSTTATFSTNNAATPLLLGTNGFLDWQGWIRWSVASGATSYHLQISTSNTFASSVLDTSGIPMDSCYVSRMTGPATYYYRVRGEQVLGAGSWSATGTFATLGKTLVSSPPFVTNKPSVTTDTVYVYASNITKVNVAVNGTIVARAVPLMLFSTGLFRFFWTPPYVLGFPSTLDLRIEDYLNPSVSIHESYTPVPSFVHKYRVSLYGETDPTTIDDVVADTSNPKNYIGRGKKVRFKLQVRNMLPTNIVTAFATIRSSSPYVTITDSIGTLNNLLYGTPVWTSDYFEIVVKDTVTQYAKARFDVIVQQELPPTGPWYSYFDLPLTPPLTLGPILFDDDNIPSSHGNGNKIAEPGETIELYPQLYNRSTDTLYSVSAKLSSVYNFINVWNNVPSVNTIVRDSLPYKMVYGLVTPVLAKDTVVPAEDFVFDYGAGSTYQFTMNLAVSGYFGGDMYSASGINVRWDVPITWNYGYPLPIFLNSFTAVASGLEAKLHWITVSETQNAGFEVDRRFINTTSSGADNWIKVGFVHGAGASASPRDYSFSDNVSVPGRYAYRLKQIDNTAVYTYSDAIEVEVGMVPRVYRLYENFPNPFNPSTTIRFSVANPGRASLRLYNTVGQEIATMFDGNVDAGYLYQTIMDGRLLSSGVYYYVLRSGTFNEAKKLMLIK